MSKIVVAVTARTGSRRLPNKVLYTLAGKPAFIHTLERVTSVVKADRVLVACTTDFRDDPIEFLARHYGIECLRGSENMVERLLTVGHRLGLKDDDILIHPGGDSVLATNKHLSWVIEQMKEHHCGAVEIVIPEGTLLRNFWPLYTLYVWKYYRADLEGRGTIGEGYSYRLQHYHFGCPKTLIVNFPPEYLTAWSWGYMCLDHIPQAGVIKEVFRRLYKDSPIDVFEVRDFLRQNPGLANTISQDLVIADQPVVEDQDSRIEEVRQNTDYVEVTWEGGEAYKPSG